MKNIPDLRYKGFDKNWDNYIVSTLYKKQKVNKAIQKNKYSTEGKFPIIDQGKQFISGYTNDSNAVNYLETIILGDHTLALKKINFPFVCGADGTVPLYFDGDFNFGYYSLYKILPPSEGYKRHFSIIKTLKTTNTSLEEQKKIGNLLSKIDLLIDEKEKEIKKYEIMLIYLANNFKYIQGTSKPISNLANVFSGGTPSTLNSLFWEKGTIPWMSSGEVNNRIINSTIKKISEYGLNNSAAKMVPINSVQIALAGQGKTRGSVSVNKIELTTNQSLASIVPNAEIYYKYLYYNLYFRYEEIRNLSAGDGGRGGLNISTIKNIKIVIPPYNEQVKIANTLENINLQIDEISTIVEKYVEVKEYLIRKMLV